MHDAMSRRDSRRRCRTWGRARKPTRATAPPHTPMPGCSSQVPPWPCLPLHVAVMPQHRARCVRLGHAAAGTPLGQRLFQLDASVVPLREAGGGWGWMGVVSAQGGRHEAGGYVDISIPTAQAAAALGARGSAEGSGKQ